MTLAPGHLNTGSDTPGLLPGRVPGSSEPLGADQVRRLRTDLGGRYFSLVFTLVPGGFYAQHAGPGGPPTHG